MWGGGGVEGSRDIAIKNLTKIASMEFSINLWPLFGDIH